MYDTERTRNGMAAVLSGERRGISGRLLFAGPAVIASIAYVDPGNFATNIQAGAGYGYQLLWVVLLANLIAMLFQALSARLGIVTEKNLAEMSRDHFPAPVVWVMWAVSEVAAMATDLAEFLGGAIGLALLFDLPIFWGMVVTATVTYGILIFEKQGFRPMELIIGTMVSIIGLCYLIELLIAPVDWGQAAVGLVRPQLPDAAALTITVGIIGATVMPHAIYLHSSLTQSRVRIRNENDRRKVLRYSNIEVVIALAIAGMVNMAMVIMAASAFHQGNSDVAEIETAYHMLTPLLGTAAASVFLVSLITSGVSSSVVGTMAGQTIMQGFLHFHVPIWLRRLVTMVPAFVVVAMGVNPTQALVMSQVVLSIALPVPMIALIIFTSRRDVMGEYAMRPVVRCLAFIGATIVLGLNFTLLANVFGISVPFLAG
ncbi:manganese transport protein MntH [Pannonibacter phragmitetus]|uniref:Nramp family divalent metal transporter n=2 Tax=Hyphomicrobiales TaxID=356 RepID=UPI00067DA667|nr:manganese transport protein MntH [Pannonibacter phragmitetus]MAA98436.1 divalent metal cation transporter [Stappia sp.]MAW89457.1 divalent metal cation transporter [Phyllobacteriaceae bacterium]MBM19148.1 divalent metal cation transporter [Stappia sp.]MBM20220.1 divalent metal cation transporter [Stappia sp.]|tara:strand:+ start:2521 stop:3807 length:1287 start_codon:yes stop_codon:yes gene_type:complete